MDAHGDVPDEILGLPVDRVPQFVARKLADKELSVIVRHLNSQALDGEPSDKERAIAALERLGFAS